MIRTLFILTLLISNSVFAQKHEPFVGKLVYKIQISDTNLREMIPPRQMVVYTNDTITRIENETDQLGKQVIIKHMGLNKSYLLVNAPNGNYAIKTDHGVDSIKSKYTFEKKLFKKKIAGVKANKLLVNHPDLKAPRKFLYLKKYSPKYINTFMELPGLPVHYFIITVDGVYEYTLTSIDFNVPNKDLFGIPSDYKKVTFDEFVDEVLMPPGSEE